MGLRIDPDQSLIGRKTIFYYCARLTSTYLLHDQRTKVCSLIIWPFIRVPSHVYMYLRITQYNRPYRVQSIMKQSMLYFPLCHIFFYVNTDDIKKYQYAYISVIKVTKTFATTTNAHPFKIC